MTRIRFPRMWRSRWRPLAPWTMAGLDSWPIAFWFGRQDDDWACRPCGDRHPPDVWFSAEATS